MPTKNTNKDFMRILVAILAAEISVRDQIDTPLSCEEVGEFYTPLADMKADKHVGCLGCCSKYIEICHRYHHFFNFSLNCIAFILVQILF